MSINHGSVSNFPYNGMLSEISSFHFNLLIQEFLFMNAHDLMINAAVLSFTLILVGLGLGFFLLKLQGGEAE